MAKSAISVRGPLIKTTIFAVVTSMILLLVAMEFGRFQFYDTKSYKADFENVSELLAGDPVMINGVRVGKVENVKVHQHTQAQVSFNVKSEFDLPAASEAVVRYRNLTGERYLEVIPKGDGVLASGTTIPIDRTRPALDLDMLLGGLEPLFEGLDHEQINRLSAELVAVLQGEGGTVESILAQTASFSSTLAERDEVIGQTIDNLNSVLANVDAHSEELSETIAGLNTLTTGLATDRERLGTSFERVDQLTSSVESLVADLRGPFAQFVADLGAMSTKVNSQRNELDMVLGRLPGFYLRIARLGSRGPGYNLYVCALRVRLTAGDGNPIYTPWVGPDPNNERCKAGDIAPGETEEELQQKLAAQRGEGGE